MKLRNYAAIFAFIGLILLAMVVMADHADAASVTWKPTSGNLASNNVNWENGTAPTTGDKAYFTVLSTSDCTWDIMSTVSSISITSGYSGTITQSSTDWPIGAGGLNQAGGTIVGNIGKKLIDGGNFITTGTSSFSNINLKMIGDGSVITVAGWPYFYSVQISANVMTTGGTNPTIINNGLLIDAGKTLTLSKEWDVAYYSGFTGIVNNGSLSGTADLLLFFKDSDSAINLGICTCPVTIYGTVSMTGSRIAHFNGNAILSALTIVSHHAPYNMILDIQGHSINVTGHITISTRAILSSSIPNAVIITNYNINVEALGELNATNIRLTPLISALPIVSPDYTRHSIAENTTYDAGFSADQTVTWTFSGNATSWLSLSGTHLTGTPTYRYVGNYSVSMKASNANGNAYYNYSIKVNNVLPSFTSVPYLIGQVGVAYTYSAAYSHPYPDVRYSIASSGDPSLVIDNITGALSGTLTISGPVLVKLTMNDSHAGFAWQNFTLNVSASNGGGGGGGGQFDYTPINGNDIIIFVNEYSGLKCSFEFSYKGDPHLISSVTWSFGDGNGSHDLSPKHTYSVAGNYTITLVVQDTHGAIATITKDVKIGNPGIWNVIGLDMWDTAVGATIAWIIIGTIALAIGYCYLAKKRGGANKILVFLILAGGTLLAISVYTGGMFL